MLERKERGDLQMFGAAIRLECRLNLRELYLEIPKSREFDNDLNKFLEANGIPPPKDEILNYASEQLIPTQINEKPPLLLVLRQSGNAFHQGGNVLRPREGVGDVAYYII